MSQHERELDLIWKVQHAVSNVEITQRCRLIMSLWRAHTPYTFNQCLLTPKASF